jgi:hypothetical protein
VPPSRRAPASNPGDSRANWGSEPVAAAELSADKVTVFAESLAQRGDLNLQIFLRDNDAWPHTAHELVFGDQRSVGLQQDQEEIEGARPQLYRNAVGDQLPPAQQHAETAEFERRFGRRLTRPIPGYPRIVQSRCHNRLYQPSPPEGVQPRIKANGALQAMLLHLRMRGCRLRIIRITP